MSSDLEAPALAIEQDGSDGRPPIPWRRLVRPAITYVLAALAVACWLGMPLLTFSHPVLSGWLVILYLLWSLVLFVVFLCALFRRRWNEVARFLAIWAVVLFPIYGSDAPRRWLQAEAFRIHASPLDQYLSRCKLTEFDENNVRQKLGVCERRGASGSAQVVIHDTAGESAVPLAQRTPEWIAAMAHFSPHMLFSQPGAQTSHLFGDFYLIDIPEQDWDGSDDDF
jgi:hypothetical protein